MISKKWFEQLIDYLNLVDEQYVDLSVKKNLNNTEKILATLSCYMEETWELSAEIRKSLELSFSQKKVDSFKKEDLEDEIFDNLFMILFLSKTLGVENLDELIERKIQKNKDRWYWIDNK